MGRIKRIEEVGVSEKQLKHLRALAIKNTKKVKITCDECKGSFKIIPSRINKSKKHFCSRSCCSKYYSRTINRKGKNNGNWKGGEKERNSRYKNRHTHICVLCNKKFSNERVEQKYCSIKCSTKDRNQSGKNNPMYSKKPHNYVKNNRYNNCEICGKEFEKNWVNGKQRFCSIKCKVEWQDLSLENNPRWLGGKSFEPYPIEFNDNLRFLIRERDNFKCKLCGKTEYENNRKLSVHHIDYNKENLSLNNLISLCISCHAKTNSIKERKMYEKLLKQKIEVMNYGIAQA